MFFLFYFFSLSGECLAGKRISYRFTVTTPPQQSNDARSILPARCACVFTAFTKASSICPETPQRLIFFFFGNYRRRRAGWDVLWQMRGLALSRPPPTRLSSPAERAARDRQALKLTMGPRRGIVACNGRAGHVQVGLFVWYRCRALCVCCCVGIVGIMVACTSVCVSPLVNHRLCNLWLSLL